MPGGWSKLCWPISAKWGAASGRLPFRESTF